MDTLSKDEMEHKPVKNLKPAWFRWLLFFTFLGLVLGVYGVVYRSDMIDVVNGQLEKIKENRVTQAYYDYTSKEFQNTYSLPVFRQFVLAYKPLFDNKTFISERQSVTDGVGKVEGILISKELHEVAVEYLLAKEDNRWKIESIHLSEIADKNKPDPLVEEIALKAHDHLKTIQNNNFTDAYYGFFSKEFQNGTSFQEFEKYVKSNPVLALFNQIDFKEGAVEHDMGYVELELHSDAGNSLVEYRFKKEDGVWKIWNIHLVLPAEEAEKKLATDPAALEVPVRLFLDAVLSGNVENAYNGTAGEFQETTSLSSFKDFARNYPVLQKRDLSDIKEGTIHDGVGTLRANLHDTEGMTVLEFKLGYEVGQWKIWGLKIIETPQIKGPVAMSDVVLSPVEGIKASEKTVNSPVEIQSIIVGDEVDSAGIIKTPRVVIDSDINLLFFNVKVENGVVGTLVTLFLNHVDSGTNAPPLSTNLKKDGLTIVAFSYAAPSGGWPLGDYVVKITLSSGQEKIQAFQIRKGEKEFY